MMYFGQEPSLGLSAKMVITDHELRRMRTGELKGCSYELAGNYVCIYVKKGKKVRIGTFDTIEECNHAYDVCDLERQIHNMRQRLRSKGYGVKKQATMTSYTVTIDGKSKSYHDKTIARMVYEDDINKQINALEKELYVMQQTKF